MSLFLGFVNIFNYIFIIFFHKVLGDLLLDFFFQIFIDVIYFKTIFSKYLLTAV